MSGRRLAFRVAARDSRRHPWRSLLVMLLVGLPVMAATTVAVLLSTFDVDATERADRELGTADAVVWFGGGPVEGQSVTPSRTYDGMYEPAGDAEKWGAVRTTPAEEYRERLAQLLPEARVVTWSGPFDARVRFGDAAVSAAVHQGDVTDPLVAERITLVAGRLPERAGEVLVGERLERRGLTVGAKVQVDLVDTPLTVVGVAEPLADAPENENFLVAATGTVPAVVAQTSYLVDQPGGVDWGQVERLNPEGVMVLSRAALENPPSGVVFDDYGSGFTDEDVALVALVVTMVLIEIALLAGPAFAVTARNQARTVALMTINGATPRQARRVVTAVAALLGGVAALLGVAAGIALAVPAIGWIQRFDGGEPGPFEVPVLGLVLIALCGLGSAALAAFVPAWQASRQDPVAVMAGRRTDRITAVRGRVSTVVGVVVLLVGVVLMSSAPVAGSDFTSSVVVVIVSTLVTVAGMVLVIPGVVAGVARLLRGRGFALRFAARDAVRHRTRTVPAVAAVAATVAGVVALGIANESDGAAQAGWSSAAEWTLPDGVLAVRWTPYLWDDEQAARVEETHAEIAAAALAKGADAAVRITRVASERGRDIDWRVDGGETFQPVWGSFADAPVVLDPERVGAEDLITLGVPASEVDRVRAALAQGQAVQFAARLTTWDEETGEEEVVPMPATADVSLVAHDYGLESDIGAPIELEAVLVRADGEWTGVSTILPTALAERLDLTTESAGAVVAGLDDPAARAAWVEQVGELTGGAHVDGWAYPEDTYDGSQDSKLIVVLLAVAGGLLMVIGTVTATLLALQDARPDLATLSAVGAGATVRRRVSTAYALLVAGVGSALGLVVGFVPGISAANSLTQGRELAVPWLELGVVVVALPLLTALVVGALTRTNQPLVQRVE